MGCTKKVGLPVPATRARDTRRVAAAGPSLTRVTKIYLSALGTTQISFYITKH